MSICLTRKILTVVSLIAISNSVFSENERSPSLTGMSVRHDTSPPIQELIRNQQELRQAGLIPDIAPDYIIPNILEIDPSPTVDKFNNKPIQSNNRGAGGGSNGLPTAPVLISVDGFTAADDTAVLGGVPLPPDTNGDVGLNFYIQYVNLGWKVMNKSNGAVAAGPFVGNTFWQGFGGPCETNNAGDPIVLFDKLASRWVFSQFTSSANTDGRQCFAVSTTSDPLGPYHRYEFLFPGEFNDYPHIGVWNDEAGQTSGYYMVTHDFFDVGGPGQAFRQASYAVVERDNMIEGTPAQFVRFTDTAFLGASSFGAQPAHLESLDLPPAGTCNPFVLGRPDQSGYQIVNLCVDWTTVANSTLSSPVIVPAGESWTPGPGSVAQPGTAATLDTLANFGRVMYRATYRSYPDTSPLTDTMVLSFPVSLPSGQAAVRWAQINFEPTVIRGGGTDIFADSFEDSFFANPMVNLVVANQGEYAPDTTDRWMSGISIDRDGNIGLAYSAASSSGNIFPGVRFTTRTANDPINTLRDEQVCVDGGGSQTDGSGRWGDYSSLSVDPVDECTFWASVEYQLTTAGRNWSNRVCSFRVDDCGSPSVAFEASVEKTVDLCSATDDIASFDYGLIGINGFSETVNLSVAGEPASSAVTFPNGATINSYPNQATFEVSNLLNIASGNNTLTLTATSVSVTKTLDYFLNISQTATNSAANLTTPVNNATGTDLLPTFNWTAIADALRYRLEVSTDSGFNNIVVSEETTELSLTSSVALETNTAYFWRITGINNCGDGTVSATSAFTTGSFVTGTAAECTGGTTPNVVFFDNIEGDVSDWTLPAAPVGTNTWTQSSARSFSGTSWFAQDVPVSSDQYLVSPAITLPSAAQSPISLSYWNYQDIEANSGVTGADSCWDGGLLEISTNGGASFTQVSSANMLGDQYNGNITVQAPSPISGQEAWCADTGITASGDVVDFAVVDLDAFAGQTVQFRFRLGTDSAAAKEGWYLDNVTVQGCQ